MKKKLSKEELKLLVRFIQKRGFVELDIQLEILDHFACKVEEILSEEPNLALSDAMARAHASFGVMGFSTIVDSYLNGIQVSFLRTLKSEFFHFMKSLQGQLLLIAYVFVYILIVQNANLKLMQWFLVGSLLTNFILTIIVLNKGWKKRKLSIRLSSFNGIIFPFYILVFNLSMQMISHINSGFLMDIKWRGGVIILLLWVMSVVSCIVERIIEKELLRLQKDEILA
ncbi:hypothetical protein ORI89_14605 [Sphingobacterium sp. UT-1RO-CII-1]|uniref:hypothetical protein n=1 Tax=Sphingobacterium sp. UT-1RO-CII-1 TaxID=2995225 RepID=UPI00227CD5D4|nr:hypothetical protein [Sphingobacterium sp. UT-1RO-CII-1]MCY4780887.1 hypothetical protein [Sphingobacterium sp. UT-1RO-CII-1]